MFTSSISEAENKLISYLPNTGSYYERKRNYSIDFETNKNTTSLLSPYIRYRAISEKNILKQVLKTHGPIKAEKYIQEIFWRTYWKGWLEHRPKVYTDYIIEKNNLYDSDQISNLKLFLTEPENWRKKNE